MSELRDSARWLAGQLAESKDAIKALSAPQLANSSIESGKVEEYDSEGTLVSVVGEQFDGTHAAVSVAGPPPPEPVAPTVTTGVNSAEVRWNGKFADDALSPMDFSHVTVHASRLESFTPDNTTQRSTITGESGDTATLALDSGEWYFLLVAVSKSGKWSTPSDVVLGVVLDYLQDAVTDALIDLDAKYDGVATEASDLAVRMTTAEQDLYVHEGRLNDADTQLTDAFGQLGTVDSRVAAAKQEAIDAGATYTDEQAEAAKFAAISAMAFSRNPSFDDWTGVTPAGYGTWGNYAPTKETSIVRRGKYAARWDCTDATNNRGMNLGSGALYDLPAGIEYWTVEVSFQLVSGTSLKGAGVLLDWAGMTGNRATLDLSAEIPNPVTGKWYSVSKTLQRPAGAAGANTGMSGYLMSNYASGLGGALAVKDIVWDWFNVRPATAEEINAGLALTMAGSKSRVYYNTSVASGAATAYGDLWRQVDAQNNIIAEWRWSGTAWVQTAISSQAISNLDLGKLTAGSATMLQATIDKLVASTASFQRADIRNLFATSGTLDTAVIEKLWTDVVHAHKITTDMLLVSKSANLLTDPDIQDVDNWSGGYASKTGGKNGKGSILIPQSSSQSGSYYGLPGTVDPANVGMRLVAGSTYRVGAWVRAADNIPVNQVKIYMRLYDGVSTAFDFADDISGNVPQNTTVIPANTWGWVSGMVKVPDDVAAVYGVLGVYKQSGFTTSAVRWSDPIVQQAAAGELVVDGSVTAEKLVSLLVLASEIIAGNPNGTHAKMTPTGFKVLAAQLDGSSPKEVLRLGTDTDDYFAVTNAQNEQVAAITSTGDMAVQTMSVNDPNGMVVGGTPLSVLTDSGGNLMGWASRGTDGLYLAGTTMQPYLSLQIDNIKGDRAYEVCTTPIGVTSDAANADAVVNLHYQSGADRPATVSDPIIAAASSVPSGWSTAKRNPVTINRLVTPSVDGTMSLLLSYGVESTGRAKITTGGGRSVLLWVKDLGPRLPETGEDRNGTANAAVSSSGGGETTAPTTSKKNYDQTWNATGLRSFLGSGGTYNYNPGYMYSGLSPAGYGDLMSMAVFPSFTSILSGATVTGVWVYVYYDFWYQGSGGDAYIGLHGQTALTSSKPAKTYSHATVLGWPRAAGKWIKMSSSTYDGFRTGQHRGFTLGGSGGGYERYGYAHNPRIRITWTK